MTYYTDDKTYTRNKPADGEVVFSYDGKINTNLMNIIDTYTDYDSQKLRKYYFEIESEKPVSVVLENVINNVLLKTDLSIYDNTNSYTVSIWPYFQYPTEIPTIRNSTKYYSHVAESPSKVLSKPNCYIYKTYNTRTTATPTFQSLIDGFIRTNEYYMPATKEIRGDTFGYYVSSGFYYVTCQYSQWILDGTPIVVDAGKGNIVTYNYNYVDLFYSGSIIDDVMHANPNHDSIYFPEQDFFLPPTDNIIHAPNQDNDVEPEQNALIVSRHEYNTDFMDIDIVGFGFNLKLFALEETDIKIKIIKKYTDTDVTDMFYGD